MDTQDVTTLDAIDTDAECACTHDELSVTAEEAEEGLLVWSEVDDLDDESNGVEDEDDDVQGRYAGVNRQSALARASIVRSCLLRHGVPEVSIELMSGRPAAGDDWNTLDPVAHMSHHIVSRPTPQNPTPGLSLVKRGRADLPGPLCNGTAGVDLVYRIITLGYANHSGYGGPLTVKGPLGNYSIPKNNGRPYIWGTEYEGGLDTRDWDRTYTNRRTGKSMTFREFMGRCNAGLSEAIWLINSRNKYPQRNAMLGGYLMEHKTWAPTRKIDRAGYTTESGRAEANRFMQDSLKGVYYVGVRRAASGKVKVPIIAVKRVQRVLRDRGYDKELVLSGMWDKPTRVAFRKFEQELHKGSKGRNVSDNFPGPWEIQKLVEGRYKVTGL